MSALQSVWFIYMQSEVWQVHFYYKRSDNGTYSEQFIFRRVVPSIQNFHSANVVKTQLIKTSKKSFQDRQERETKLQLVNQQCVVYQFQCNLCDTGSYVGNTHRHLHARVDDHNSTSTSVHKHYDKNHAGAIPEGHLVSFKVLKNCRTKPD